MPTRSSGSVRIFYPAFERAELVRTLEARLDRLRAALPLVKVVLFGSCARGTHTVASDVDLLVVYRRRPQPDAYGVVKRVLGVPRLEPHLYTEEEFAAARATVERMTRDGVILWGPGAPRTASS
jgi:hypothetical protein